MKALLEGKCPICKQGTIFRAKGNLLRLKAPVMETSCSHCGYRFEKEPGYFLGAMYVSYALGVAQLIVAYLLISPFVSLGVLFILLFLVLLLFSLWNFRVSRVIWIHLFSR